MTIFFHKICHWGDFSSCYRDFDSLSEIPVYKEITTYSPRLYGKVEQFLYI